MRTAERSGTGTGYLTPRPSIRRALRLVQRNLLVYKHGWMVIFSGFWEPVFYLFGVGLGIGAIVGEVEFAGRSIPYAAFIAPALLAASCMNGAITDGFVNVFFKLNFERTYEGVLATPLGIRDIALGEMTWAMIRGTGYAVGFLAVITGMGLVLSPWAILAVPAALLVSGAFASFALVITSYATRLDHFDVVMGLIVMPMFLFSATFFPLSVYPAFLQPVIQLSPLFHAAGLLRDLTTGIVGRDSIIHVTFLGAMMAGSLAVAMRRLEKRTFT